MNLHVRVEAPGAPAAGSVIDAAEIEIGRTAKPPGIVVSDPSVSRQHARIIARNGGWWIEALSPKNPTYVNQIAIDAARELSPGDVIRVGHASIHILGAPGEAAASASFMSMPEDARQAARLRTLNEVHRALIRRIKHCLGRRQLTLAPTG